MKYYGTLLAALVPSLVTAQTDIPTTGPGVWQCTGAEWTGDCYYDRYDITGTCWSWKNTTAWISSFGPDQGLTCTLYSIKYCSGDTYTTQYPGVSDLSTVGWSDKMLSFECVFTYQGDVEEKDKLIAEPTATIEYGTST